MTTDQSEPTITSPADHFAVDDRDRHHLSAGTARQEADDVWRFTQRGLVYPSPYAVFAAFSRGDTAGGSPMTRATLGAVVADVREAIHTEFGSAHTTAVMAVGFDLWAEVSENDEVSTPAGMTSAFPCDDGAPHRSELFQREGTAFADSAIDLWFHVKSDESDHCTAVAELIRRRVVEVEGWMDDSRTVIQAAATKSNRDDRLGGKVVGSRFSENLNNSTDPLTIQRHAVVGLDDPEHLGGSFVLAQRFAIDWRAVLAMAPGHVEDMVGRTTHDTLIPTRDERSHIKRSRAQDDAGNTTPVLRLGLPYGHSDATTDPALRAQGASLRDEEGIYFAGYSKSAAVLERIMDRQIGDNPAVMSDRLLAHVNADIGGLLYVPSLTDLCLPIADPVTPSNGRPERFPGVDWTRLDRHFDMASPNGLMHYNHKEYLYRMATMSAEERSRLLPPSPRVLSLLADSFSRWQDNWYVERAQPELGHLRGYLSGELGEEPADEIMSESVAVRTGWAARMLLGRVIVSDSYGFRGQRRDDDGHLVTGADTYRIQPAEIIVGAMPNLGLGEGKYLIDFARDDEQLSNFFDDLSYASGVGHVVPRLALVLDHGLDALVANADTAAAEATTAARRDFHSGTALALRGVSEHAEAFARLADRMADDMGPGRGAEADNLRSIAERMRRVAHDRPSSFVDAVQLLFTLHSCLHHAGEPTAVGRFDQMLLPFYDADVAAGELDPDEAQEIVDCFWIKLGEKVLLNRQFVEDHQVFGNLAMGGASAPYPQGSSINQWIQQVTVGGTVADDAPGAGTPAYNELTRLCLRAARRLPLNAPCLSLRVRADMPEEFAEEAAAAILSGGAHPILVSDEKTIPGLVASGDGIGAGHSESASTPVAARAAGLFDSEVSLRDARDYACDGCYEPQLAGASWFTLGGMVSTVPLECALNQGKTWQAAGPAWFRGTRVSFTSEPADDIDSFDRVLELYFTHLRWMYAKQAHGQLMAFGRMQDVCPSPLMSVFIDDCVDKGLDYYAGGARYNVVAPCFTGLSTLVDSMWAIRSLVFDDKTAVTSLPELVSALRCDWGEKMVEPFISVLEGPARIEAKAERFRRIRAAAMALPKFGRGHAEVDAFGDDLVGRVARTAVEVFTDPVERTAARMVELAQQLGTPEHPFGGFQIQPGVGSFENYLDWGASTGASADGRRSSDPIASDLSPAPSYGDLPVDPRERPLLEALQGYSGDGVVAMWDGSPVDVNIAEDFPPADLAEAIMAFAGGCGSSLLTITCADADTMTEATRDPEKYDLLRVRMGGWSEFFVAMFPGHQQQHRRRPRSTPWQPKPIPENEETQS